MLKITKKLKDHFVAKKWCAADATDAVFKSAVGQKLAKNEITPAKLKELATEKAAPPATPPAVPPKKKGGEAAMTEEEINKLVSDRVDARLDVAIKAAGFGGSPTINPVEMMSKASDIRVKSASEAYANTKKSAIYPIKSGASGQGGLHPLAGQPARFAGTPLDHPSDLDKAVAGAFFKWNLSTTTSPHSIPRALRMTDHDRDLVQWSIRNMPWNGLVGAKGEVEGGTKVDRRKLTELEQKALLDDGTSGGIEAAPIAFDDAMILIPVLYGELFPGVNVINVARGRRMEGVAMQNPTFSSSTEGTPITVFNTAGFISAFDTTIYAAAGAIEMGLDWQEDSPIGFGAQIVEQYGLKALEWLDRVIAVGNGTTEPLGIVNTASPVVVNSDNGAGGLLTVGDHEGLMFGLAKQYRNEAGANNVYLGNDLMYRRARSIQVGPSDERRVFGMDHASYMLLDTPYKINASLSNGTIAYANLRRYRMYRRLGLQVRVENSGRTLALSNQQLIVVRMRFGGQMETGAAVARMTDGHN